MPLSITEFRQHCDALGRYASIRETAHNPTDRVLIQFDGVLKFVAGDESSTLIVDTGVPVEGKGKALVSARLLLTAGKALRGKGSIELALDGRGGAVMKTTTGGKVVLPRVGDSLPGWVRVTDSETHVMARFAKGFWPDLVKLVSVSPKSWPWAQQVNLIAEGDQLRLDWSDNYTLVYATAKAAVLADRQELGAVSLDYVKSLKVATGEGYLMVHRDTVEVVSGQYRAVSSLATAQWPRPELKPVEPASKVAVSRSQLLEVVKGAAPHDEHNRVAIRLTPGHLTVNAFGHERDGVLSIPARVSGDLRSVGVDASMLSKLLTALPGKEVEFGLPADGGPIAFKEGTWGWRVLLAPVALN